MTRALSELLGAEEPMFHHDLTRLETASGHTGADIRLTAEVERATRLKLKELGLDPRDTTGIELYRALQSRIKRDDQLLANALRAKYGEDERIHVSIGKALHELPIARSCFALKSAVAKRLLKKLPPKQTMKALGYRSFDSMVRREQLTTIFAAAWLVESATWRKNLVDGYKKLQSSDFEIRNLAVIGPDTPYWRKLASTLVAEKKHTVVGLKEFGAVVILPFPEEVPPAMTMTTMLVALHEMNTVRAACTFMKLCQVRPDFGSIVQSVVTDEPVLEAQMLGGPVPWHIIQRYYARFSERFREDLFEPHIQREDLSWHSIEKALSFLEPDISFWHHTGTLGILDGNKPVSMNIVDVALGFCNGLPYERRIVHYFRHSLWSELVMRYLKHENVEQAVLGSLESRLVDEA